ncbi:MAG: hypothetical protein QNJ14_09130 [Woeseiaceae bacterium]|nr:hypothetical protein [Woeseiaceae bacterium]
MTNLRTISLLAAFVLAGCGQEAGAPAGDVVAVDKSAVDTAKPMAKWDGEVAKPGAPFRVSYRIIGTPVVGAPLSIDLRVTSPLGPQAVDLSYRIPDETAMSLHEAQPARLVAEFATNEDYVDQRITIVPQREGRLFLNVGAAIDTETGRASTTIAIPIQVGQGARELEEHGELGTDEEGESIRILTSE